MATEAWLQLQSIYGSIDIITQIYLKDQFATFNLDVSLQYCCYTYSDSQIPCGSDERYYPNYVYTWLNAQHTFLLLLSPHIFLSMVNKA